MWQKTTKYKQLTVSKHLLNLKLAFIMIALFLMKLTKQNKSFTIKNTAQAIHTLQTDHYFLNIM